jgi:transcriptional regulator with XRE-family HTH domain
MLNDQIMTRAAGVGTLTPVDQHVARRIRGKRLALGLTKDNLAAALGIDPALLDAYEQATARVPAEQLILVSEFFGVPVSYFFPSERGPCPG